MKENNTAKKIMLLTAAATAVYSAVAGKGPFNRFRFKMQHEELGKYVDTNYPGCTYSPISAHGRGYSSTILSMGRPVSFVYFSKGEDGMYVFTELEEKMK